MPLNITPGLCFLGYSFLDLGVLRVCLVVILNSSRFDMSSEYTAVVAYCLVF